MAGGGGERRFLCQPGARLSLAPSFPAVNAVRTDAEHSECCARLLLRPTRRQEACVHSVHFSGLGIIASVDLTSPTIAAGQEGKSTEMKRVYSSTNSQLGRVYSAAGMDRAYSRIPDGRFQVAPTRGRFDGRRASRTY